MYLQLHVFLLLDLGVLAVCLSSLLNISVCQGASQHHTTHFVRNRLNIFLNPSRWLLSLPLLDKKFFDLVPVSLSSLLH
jgi:hypothetical protein